MLLLFESTLVSKPVSATKQWRLNASLLNDMDFVTFVTTIWIQMLEIKCHLSFSGTVPRHTYEVVLFHLQVRKKKKKREAKQSKVEDKIRQLEQQHKRASTSKLFAALKQVHIDFNSLTTEKTESNLRFTNSFIAKFIWQGRRLGITLKTLQLSKTCGGLKLLNIRHYFGLRN